MATSHHPDGTASGLREQILALAAELEQTAKSQGAQALETSSEAVRDLLARANVLVDALSDAEKAKALVMKGAVEGRHRLEDTIKAEPFLAIGIAALAGFLLGSLRRHR